MSYLVLARKWRPQTFEDVIGQEHVTTALRNSLREDHLAHALLFSGPRGVGKTSIARILAKAINCEHGPAPSPCNKCGICKEITEGAAVDVLEIDGASNRGIDEIRQLRESIRFQPVVCRSRVFIIDEVHMLTKEAFNALLKTLEEPPPHVFFIFATTEPHRIPATIHSRCQHYEFRRVETKRLAEHLSNIIRNEGMALPDEASLLLAREADGSVRDSLSLLDQVAAYGATTLEDVHEALGIIGSSTLETLAQAIMKGDTETALEVAADVYRLGVDFLKFTGDLALFFRNILVIKKTNIHSAARLTDLEVEYAAALKEKFDGFSSSSILNILNLLMKDQALLASSSTPRLSLELLLIKLCSTHEVAKADIIVSELKNAIEKGLPHHIQDAQPSILTGADYKTCSRPDVQASQVKEERHHSPSTRIRQHPDEELPGPSHQPDDITEHASPTAKTSEVQLDVESWEAFVKHVSSIKPSLASMLRTAKVELAPETNTVRLCCSASMYEMLSDHDYSNLLENMAKSFFKMSINFKPVRNVAATKKKQENRATSDNRKESLLGHPLINHALQIFNARVSNYHMTSSQRAGK